MVHIAFSAKTADFHRAYASPIRAMWHYRSPDHTLSEMANEKYFRTVMQHVQPGDLIHAIDRNEDEAIFRVQYLDDELLEVGIGLERMVEYEPCTETGYQIRHVGGHGRGARYQVIDPTGKAISDEIVGRKAAQRALAQIEENVTRPDAA